MFVTPYSTTIGRRFRLDRVMAKLQEADILKQLSVLDPERPWLVGVVGTETVEIPSFNHPVTMTDPNRGTKVVVDLRSYKRLLNIQPSGVIVSPHGGAALSVNRAILQYYWNEESADSYLDNSDLPTQIFARWLTARVSSGVNADLLQQTRLPVLFAYFYNALFVPEGSFTRQDAVRLAPKIARLLNIKDISWVVNNTPAVIPSNVDQLVDLLSSGEYGVRLESMSAALFWQITTGGMHGLLNAPEVMAVAVEYPPTFLALVYSAVNDTSYNKTPLTQAAKLYARGTTFKDFNQAFDGLLTGR